MKTQKSAHFKKWVRRFLADERGQSTTEYILILAVVLLVASKFKGVFVQKMDKATGDLGTRLDGFINEDQ